MTRKTLVISGNSSYESILKYTHIDNADVFYAFKGAWSKVLSFLRIEWIRRGLPHEHIWYKNIRLDQYEKIIVLDALISIKYLSFLKEKFSGKDIFFYYWNLCRPEKINPEEVKALGINVWSFDEDDCERYSLKYNPQFYAKSWYTKQFNDCFFDISFVGRDKGNRVQKVDELIKLFNAQGLSTQTYITADKWYKRFSSKRYRAHLDFEQVIAKECEGRAVLDFGQENQSGSTLRFYDGLLNKRKVITNLASVKKSRMYSRENVFVIGVDSIESLKRFVTSPFHEIPIEDVEYYCSENWVDRFK